jgi:signal transduction histidine kinase
LHACESAVGEFDAPRIEQVFSNLISNAVHHGNKRSPVSVSVESAQSEVVFSVHNEGTPIPKEVLPTIFQPLKRYTPGVGAAQLANGGLGLGLHIASEIVEAHQGKIEVESGSAGTTFTVRLPKEAP